MTTERAVNVATYVLCDGLTDGQIGTWHCKKGGAAAYCELGKLNCRNGILRNARPLAHQLNASRTMFIVQVQRVLSWNSVKFVAEIIWCSGFVPVDRNNAHIMKPDRKVQHLKVA